MACNLMADTFWVGEVKTPHGKLLVSVEAVNDAGSDLVLRVQLDPIHGFKFKDSGLYAAGEHRVLSGDMVHD